MPEKLTQEQLAAIRERCEKATPGAWSPVFAKTTAQNPYPEVKHICGGDGQFALYASCVSGCDCSGETVIESDNIGPNNEDLNVSFIAAARSDVPALLKHIAALEKEQLQIKKINGKIIIHYEQCVTLQQAAFLLLERIIDLRVDVASNNENLVSVDLGNCIYDARRLTEKLERLQEDLGLE